MFLSFLINNIKLSTNQGILYDLDIMREMFAEKICDYKIKVDDDYRHEVIIKLKNFSEDSAAVLFGEIIVFLSFSYLNYFERQRFDDYVKYTYITAPDENGGYLINIIFK